MSAVGMWKKAVVTLGIFRICPTLITTQEKWSQTSIAGMEMCFRVESFQVPRHAIALNYHTDGVYNVYTYISIQEISMLKPVCFQSGRGFLIDLGFVYWVCFGLPGKFFFEILDPLSEQDLLLSARKSPPGLPFQNPICAPVYTIHCIIMYNHECMYIWLYHGYIGFMLYTSRFFVL